VIAFVRYYPLRGDGENAVKLAWLLRRSPVVLPIPGTLSLAHLRENLARARTRPRRSGRHRELNPQCA
jgi:aryl-alcohol dehydrogenase-like predicted oxidoreductase